MTLIYTNTHVFLRYQIQLQLSISNTVTSHDITSLWFRFIDEAAENTSLDEKLDLSHVIIIFVLGQKTKQNKNAAAEIRF